MQTDNIGVQQVIEQYMAIWNESDSAARRASIAKIWTEDAVQFTTNNEYRGYEALEQRVTSAHEQFVQQGGFVFRPSGEVQAHHDAIKFTWEMVPAAGGEVAAVGTIFGLLSDDGRVRLDYQF